LLTVGEEPVVLARYVVGGPASPLSVREPDDLQRRMGVRVGRLALEHLEAPAEHVGLRGAELLRQALETLPLDCVEVDLHRLADPSLGGAHDINSCHHD